MAASPLLILNSRRSVGSRADGRRKETNFGRAASVGCSLPFSHAASKLPPDFPCSLVGLNAVSSVYRSSLPPLAPPPPGVSDGGQTRHQPATHTLFSHSFLGPEKYSNESGLRTLASAKLPLEPR
ncbi:unnamed protein product [Caenorhabditis auriculariae]|uniref:Uncharacterized protein n=1 Tax=Caenorhabditis auriculariae TaxID=2777116 RepID=A0A8S1GTF1_9PELO|nr:unnamed protein product [Caenorhabditis auriculariae]